MEIDQYKCKHKFVYMRTDSHYKAYRYNNTFVLNDYFFCEKCLKEQVTTKSQSVNIGNMPPDWAQGITTRINVD